MLVPTVENNEIILPAVHVVLVKLQNTSQMCLILLIQLSFYSCNYMASFLLDRESLKVTGSECASITFSLYKARTSFGWQSNDHQRVCK